MRTRRLFVSTTIVAMFLGALPEDGTAYEFRQRFVRREGTTDTPIIGDHLDIAAPPEGITVRVRFQIGVFDDASGPAPAGGVVGWNFGIINGMFVEGFELTRTPGRLVPFNFSPSPNANGNPPTDPFTALTEIDNTLGTQAPFWPAGSDPATPPPPVIRGLNAFVSLYEISIRPRDPGIHANTVITFAGDLIAASEWRTIGTPIPPTPEEPGQILYAPFPTASLPFQRTLSVLAFPVPGPAATGAVVMGVMAWRTRRRRDG